MHTRNEQKEQRRQLILTKSLKLFVKKGYSETKISDIATASNMSVGLLFHYFESKEKLYEALVKIGLEGTNIPQKIDHNNPLEYFKNFLTELFSYAKVNPWVSYMFVLMWQTQKNEGLPPHIREIALKVNQIEYSAKIIENGQKDGYFRKGDPLALSNAFWCSLQGIMEYFVVKPDTPFPEPDWIIDIIKGENAV